MAQWLVFSLLWVQIKGFLVTQYWLVLGRDTNVFKMNKLLVLQFTKISINHCIIYLSM